VKTKAISIAVFYFSFLFNSQATEPEPPQWVKDQNGLYKNYVSLLIDNGTIKNDVEKRVLKSLDKSSLVPGPLFFLGYIQRIDMIAAPQGMIDPKIAPAKRGELAYGDEGEARVQAWRTPLISYYDDTIDHRHVGIYLFARETHYWAYTFGNRMWDFRTPTQVCIIVTDFQTGDLLSWTHREQGEMPDKRVYRPEDHTLIITDRVDYIIRTNPKIETYKIGIRKIEGPS
jgi:hypothetical protein